jgi:type I restriction enzyme S subunit
VRSQKLGEICQLSKGKTITRATATEGDVPVIGGGLGPTYFHDKANTHPPVITVSASGANAGFVNFWEVPIWASDCTTIKVAEGSPASIGFIFKFLQNKQEFINKHLRRGSAQPHVYPTDLAELEILLPSQEIQHEIVKKLDSAFVEIDLLEMNLEKLERYTDELLGSIQQDLFSSDFKSVLIGDVCKLSTGGTPSRNRPEYFLNGSVKWLVSGDIHQGEIHDCDGRITLEAVKSSNTKILPLNSVMIALNGQGKTRGTVAILRTEATCNQSLVSISPNDEAKLIPEFLYYNLKMRYQELRRMTGDDGNDRRGLNMNLIRGVLIPLPPIAQQRLIIGALDTAYSEIDLMKDKVRVKREIAEQLRQSLLHEAFSNLGATL